MTQMQGTGYTLINDEIIWDKFYTFNDGSPRPKCANRGCFKPVVCSSGGQKSEHPSQRSLRTVCSSCHNASYGKTVNGKVVKLAEGVTSIKKNFCENIDGRLLVPCTATMLDSAQLELDHIDGNHIKNLPENIQTLCKNCHSKKSIAAGDYRKITKSCKSPAIFTKLLA